MLRHFFNDAIKDTHTSYISTFLFFINRLFFLFEFTCLWSLLAFLKDVWSWSQRWLWTNSVMYEQTVKYSSFCSDCNQERLLGNISFTWAACWNPPILLFVLCVPESLSKTPQMRQNRYCSQDQRIFVAFCALKMWWQSIFESWINQ